MRTALALILTCLATAALAEPQCTLGELPDQRPGCTPGAAATSDHADITSTAGGTYSQRHRLSQTPEIKRQVLERYGVPWADRSQYEDDHDLPLCAGGSDAIENRWPQQLTGEWNAHDKDRLESESCLAIRQGRITVAEAQARFLAPADWRVSYCAVFPTDKRCRT